MTNKNSLTRDLDECDFMDLFSTSIVSKREVVQIPAMDYNQKDQY